MNLQKRAKQLLADLKSFEKLMSEENKINYVKMEMEIIQLDGVIIQLDGVVEAMKEAQEAQRDYIKWEAK